MAETSCGRLVRRTECMRWRRSSRPSCSGCVNSKSVLARPPHSTAVESLFFRDELTSDPAPHRATQLESTRGGIGGVLGDDRESARVSDLEARLDMLAAAMTATKARKNQPLLFLVASS